MERHTVARINLGIQTYQSRSKPLLSQRIVNLYAEQEPNEAKSQIAVFNTPGFILFANINTDPVYGMINVKETLFAVLGNNLFEIDSTGSETDRGSMGSITGMVQMSQNGNGDQVIVLKPDQTMWVYTISTTTLAQVTDADFPGADTVTFLGNYTVVNDPGTGQFFWSALTDATSWDALDFTTAERAPDNIEAVFARQSELWIFGTDTIEIFYIVGDADAPFQRVENAFIEEGLGAKFSVAKDEKYIYWLGEDRIIYRASGYRGERISNHGIENTLREMTTVNDAFAFTYSQEGHEFYSLTFPTEAKTFCYDSTTGLWHERESFDVGRWRANAHAFIFGKNLVGDYNTGKIYELDLETYTENGTTIERIHTFPPVWAENKRVIFDMLNIDFEGGVGLTTGQGSDPQAMLDWSDDGGFTWSNQHWRSMGGIGEYKTRVTWRRLGQGRQRIFRVKISDPIKTIINGAYTEVRPGGNI